MIDEAPCTFTVALYSSSVAAWLTPLPLPFSVMSVLTTAASAGVPVQTVIPVNEVAVFPEYAQVPVPPATVNLPLEVEPCGRGDVERPAAERLARAV